MLALWAARRVRAGKGRVGLQGLGEMKGGSGRLARSPGGLPPPRQGVVSEAGGRGTRTGRSAGGRAPAASVGAGEDDAFGHLGEAGGDAVTERGAQLGGRQVGGDEGREHALVPVVDEPVGQLLGPLAGLCRAEIVQEEQRAAGQRLEVPLGVVAVAGAESRVEVGGGGGFPAQADASREKRAEGTVRLVGFAGSGGADDQQRRALGDAGSAGTGAPGAGDLVGPGGDQRVVGQGSSVAGGDTGVGELQCRDRLGWRFLGRGTGFDAPAGQDRVEPVGERANAAGLSGEGRGQSSPP